MPDDVGKGVSRRRRNRRQRRTTGRRSAFATTLIVLAATTTITNLSIQGRDSSSVFTLSGQITGGFAGLTRLIELHVDESLQIRLGRGLLALFPMLGNRLDGWAELPAFEELLRRLGRSGVGSLLGGSLRVSAPWKLAEAFLAPRDKAVRPV